MTIVIVVDTTDSLVVQSLMNAVNIANSRPIDIGQGAKLSHVTGGGFGASKGRLHKFVLTGVTAVSLNLVASYIYERLSKDPQVSCVVINNQTVEVNLQQITYALSASIALSSAADSSDKGIAADKPKR